MMMKHRLPASTDCLHAFRSFIFDPVSVRLHHDGDEVALTFKALAVLAKSLAYALHWRLKPGLPKWLNTIPAG